MRKLCTAALALALIASPATADPVPQSSMFLTLDGERLPVFGIEELDEFWRRARAPSLKEARIAIRAKFGIPPFIFWDLNGGENSTQIIIKDVVLTDDQATLGLNSLTVDLIVRQRPGMHGVGRRKIVVPMEPKHVD